VLAKVDIKGLTHTSKLDREIWNEFHANWNVLVWEADRLRTGLGSISFEEQGLKAPSSPSEVTRPAKQRVHQAFFRDAVLSSYESTCCVTGLTLPECLIASHIVPWSEDERFRTDPTNGLCLSATFDRLFDSGLMTVTRDLVIRFSSCLMKRKNLVIDSLICVYEGQHIKKPHRFLPCPERLEWHVKNRFEKKLLPLRWINP
jgi:putative restriction endonuclease